MVQKVDKGNTDPKKEIATKIDATNKNQSQHLSKPSTKTGKSVIRKDDPSGLPKYR